VLQLVRLPNVFYLILHTPALLNRSKALCSSGTVSYRADLLCAYDLHLLQINALVSNLRTRPKGISDKKVEGFYQLLAGDDAGSRVKALTNEDQDYIYPAAVCSFESSKSLLILTRSSLSFRVEGLILTVHIFIHASFPP